MANDLLITSRSNPSVKLAGAVRAGRDDGRILIEGLRLCEEAVESGVEVEFALFATGLMQSERGPKLLERLRTRTPGLFETTSSILASMSDTKTTQGVVIIARRPARRSLSEILSGESKRIILILHRISDPANTGAILRTAEAAGVGAIIATVGTADLFSPKSLRSSMGSAFRLPIAEKVAFEQAVEICSSHGFCVTGAAPRSTVVYTDLDWRRPVAVVLGSEASGLTEAEMNLLDATVAIPMNSPVEILNVAATAAVILFEAVRQSRGRLDD